MENLKSNGETHSAIGAATVELTFEKRISCLNGLRRICHFTALLVLCLMGLSPASAHEFKVLVFSKTAAFRHASIPDGIAMIQSLGTNNGFIVHATEDATAFTDTNLTQYSAVVFLSTTGDVLDINQQGAFERFIRSGKGYVGIHSASDTEYSWPWYGQLVGAYFNNHPSQQTATNLVLDRAHPSTAGLPERWVRFDEWYNFQSNPRGSVHVLATLDEKSYAPGTGAMGYDHPIAWCHNFDGGRSWYTGGGHTSASFSEPLFRQHVLGGILWAAGDVEGDAGATIDSNFQKTVLDSAPSNPMELAVAADGRVFYIERGGAVKIWKPQTATTVLAAQIPVFSQLEDGLIGLTLDPGFMTNNWLYLYYSPAGATPRQYLSRFTMNGDVMNLASEKILLIASTQRDQCCHSGGSLAFGPDGTLYVSVGDNTNPFESDGYCPTDERPGRSAWDAQKSSSNGNDLRGKILRIKPETNGTYSIPPGNLFPPGTPNTRPEIYVMGNRNPFRIAVDSATGWLYWGEVGPDSGADSATRGPRGHDEWNQARTAGNYGWPYFVANNKAYIEYDFATLISGAAYNPNFPTNNSPNNTGPLVLPPARPAWIWYAGGNSTEFPQVNQVTTGGRTAMAGPVYHFNTNGVAARRLPAYYDNTHFIYEWSRNFIREVKLDASGNILAINPFLPTFTFTRPMDMEIGPDGAIYMIEWGTGFNGNNADAKIIRIDYVAGNRTPVIVASATPDSGSAPLVVNFSSAGTFDPDPQDTLSFAWSFFGNNVTNSTSANPTFTYTNAGSYAPQLKVYDSSGNVSVRNFTIIVGNHRPTTAITRPPNGAVFDWSDTISFTASATDFEDGSTTNGTINCTNLNMELSVGHADHAHGLAQLLGCTGSFVTPPGHGDEADNLYLVFRASYTDKGAPGVPTLLGSSTSLVRPRRMQAEYFTSDSGVSTYITPDTDGALEVMNIDHGDWVSVYPMNFTNLTGATFRVAAAGAGGQIEIRLGGTNGTLLTTATIPPTANNYTNVTVAFTNPGGTHEVFFVFKASPGATDLFRWNWIQFAGPGIGIAAAPDLTPPTVIFERPASGASFNVGQTVPVVVSVTDNLLVATREFYVDGVLQTLTGTSPYSLQVTGLLAGAHSLSMRASDYAGNRTTNTVALNLVNTVLPKGPYGGVAHRLPCRIELENFDQGGSGFGYFDTSGGNSGGAYRTAENVDIQSTTDSAGGLFNVGWINSTDWLEYTVTIPTGGVYTAQLRAAAQVSAPGIVTATLSGNTIGTFNIPNTGGWQTWATVTLTNLNLPAATNVPLRLTSTGTNGFLHNLNWIEFTYVPPPMLTPVVEWTTVLPGGFVTLSNAVVNTNTRSVLVPRSGNSKFYRLRSNYPTQITNIQTSGTNLLLKY